MAGGTDVANRFVLSCWTVQGAFVLSDLLVVGTCAFGTGRQSRGSALRTSGGASLAFVGGAVGVKAVTAAGDTGACTRVEVVIGDAAVSFIAVGRIGDTCYTFAGTKFALETEGGGDELPIGTGGSTLSLSHNFVVAVGSVVLAGVTLR